MKKIDLTNFEGTADQLGEQVFKQLIAPMLDEMKSQDTKEQRQAFDEWHYEQYLLENPNIDISNAKYIYDYAHKNVLVFQLKESHFTAWQAVKAQAVPEGFVVVNQKDLLELTIAINAVDLATHTESKTNEVREMWQQVALKLMALGTAQEPANDL